jgi:aspartate ammonia-lyase
MLSEPIELTLYDENSEPIKTYKCLVIPWGMLKKALSLQKYISKESEEFDDGIVDAMAQFVCDLYRDQFTVEDLNNGADLTEVMAAISAVVSHAGALNPNV